MSPDELGFVLLQPGLETRKTGRVLPTEATAWELTCSRSSGAQREVWGAVHARILADPEATPVAHASGPWLLSLQPGRQFRHPSNGTQTQRKRAVPDGFCAVYDSALGISSPPRVRPFTNFVEIWIGFFFPFPFLFLRRDKRHSETISYLPESLISSCVTHQASV